MITGDEMFRLETRAQALAEQMAEEDPDMIRDLEASLGPNARPVEALYDGILSDLLYAARNDLPDPYLEEA